MRQSTPSGSRAPCSVELLESRRLLSAAANYVAGELLVGFAPGTSQRDISSFYAQHGVSERESLDPRGQHNAKHLRLVSVPAARTMQLIPELNRDPRVAYAEPNYLMHAAAVTPTDTQYPVQWNLNNTGQWSSVPDADI